MSGPGPDGGREPDGAHEPVDAHEPVGVGVIGCGNISKAYLDGLARFPVLRTVACADRDPEAARAAAARHGIRAMGVDELLAEPAIEIVVNLTVPLAHAEVSRRVIAAGRHLYSEKPLAVEAADGRAIVAEAEAAGLTVGCAPDTFLGASHQAARALVDDGAIGRVLSGACCVMSRGPEGWHPNPDFFYRRGAGPLLDIGPYYVTAIVNLLGAVRRVRAVATRGETRTIGSGPRAGERLPVEVPTTVHGILEMETGAVVTLATSWDVWAHAREPIEVHGEAGSMLVPDPNFFAGTLRVAERDGPWREIDHGAHDFGALNFTDSKGVRRANYRALGVADMARALREGRRPRASGALAAHALDVMEALHVAAERDEAVAIGSRVERPAPLRPGEIAMR